MLSVKVLHEIGPNPDFCHLNSKSLHIYLHPVQISFLPWSAICVITHCLYMKLHNHWFLESLLALLSHVRFLVYSLYLTCLSYFVSYCPTGLILLFPFPLLFCLRSLILPDNTKSIAFPLLSHLTSFLTLLDAPLGRIVYFQPPQYLLNPLKSAKWEYHVLLALWLNSIKK